MIYIVTTGEYSDYRIAAVFLTRAEAEAYAGGESHSTIDEAPNIEEWEVGPPDPTKWWQKVYYHSLKPNGETYHMYACWQEVGREYTKIDIPYPKQWDKYPQTYCVMAQSVISAEHAKKLAVEARQAWIVRNPQ